jgi:branched-chain amino acid transport system ATP-binding protein
MSDALLDIRGLTAGYGDVPVLTDIALTVGAGEIVALVGSNGAGKTTLLRAVSRIIKASGSLRFLGEDVLPLTPEALFARGLVQVPEGRQLFGRMTVAENLMMGAYRRRDRAGIDASLAQTFDLFPVLAERRAQTAGSLSGGEQQMCAIGRALMAAPKLLMIDEMSLGLAPIVVDRLLDVLVAIRGQGVPILMVEQDVFAALAVADRGYVLEHGRIVKAATAETLKSDPALQKAYLGSDS